MKPQAAPPNMRRIIAGMKRNGEAVAGAWIKTTALVAHR
jgi:hypothetical protein